MGDTAPTAQQGSRRRLAGAISPPLLWACLIFLASSVSFSGQGGLPLHADKVIHALEFGILSALLARALLLLRHASARASGGLLAAAAVLATLFGLSDEFHQSFVPGRHASAWDLCADAFGACTASLILFVVSKRRGG